ncbi:hypothetical protein [Caldisphaera sp.]|uniref:hypothetical protein n=1 Tax=Caldisphaera sp. TaxID=2060322 RepID=UPI0025C1233E|nr:hypothetical protein [Caldisphaera sp.]
MKPYLNKINIIFFSIIIVAYLLQLISIQIFVRLEPYFMGAFKVPYIINEALAKIAYISRVLIELIVVLAAIYFIFMKEKLISIFSIFYVLFMIIPAIIISFSQSIYLSYITSPLGLLFISISVLIPPLMMLLSIYNYRNYVQLLLKTLFGLSMLLSSLFFVLTFLSNMLFIYPPINLYPLSLYLFSIGFFVLAYFEIKNSGKYKILIASIISILIVFPLTYYSLTNTLFKYVFNMSMQTSL